MLKLHLQHSHGTRLHVRQRPLQLVASNVRSLQVWECASITPLWRYGSLHNRFTPFTDQFRSLTVYLISIAISTIANITFYDSNSFAVFQYSGNVCFLP